MIPKNKKAEKNKRNPKVLKQKASKPKLEPKASKKNTKKSQKTEEVKVQVNRKRAK